MTSEQYMRLALREARRGLGRTSPNPAVGALLVKNDRILSHGHHRRAGEPHAEIEALRQLEDSALARDAALYITLEPCSSHGRTPPCTEAIIRAGIRRVVTGATDPNPAHQGRGLRQLAAAGIEVISGVLESECQALNVGFNRWITTGTPWVIAKLARSLDGGITRAPHEERWLTNPLSRRRVQQLRATVDAILIGAETARRDDPELTVRGFDRETQPWRVIVSRSGNLSTNLRLLSDQHRERTLVFQAKPWREILQDLGRRGVTRLLVEGGGEVVGDLFDQGLIDELWMFVAPLLTGSDKPAFAGRGVSSNEAAVHLDEPRFFRYADDLLIRGFVRKE